LGEDLAPREDRARRIAELVLLELGDAGEDRVARGRIVGGLGLLAQDRDEVLPAALLLVQARERGGGVRAAGRAVRIGAEQALVRGGGAGRVAELHVVHL